MMEIEITKILILQPILKHNKLLHTQLQPSTGLEITNRQALVTMSGQTSFCSDATRFWQVKLEQS